MPCAWGGGYMLHFITILLQLFEHCLPLVCFLLEMLFSASLLLYNMTANYFVVEKQSYESGSISCSVQQIIPAESDQILFQSAIYLDEKLLVFSNKSDETFVQVYDTVEKAWSGEISVGPSMENMKLLPLQGNSEFE